jgi:hypothetical protein
MAEGESTTEARRAAHYRGEGRVRARRLRSSPWARNPR